jgi:uncharacterized membrane protein
MREIVMGELIWAVIAFIGTHFLLSHPLRAPLVKAVGEKAFSGIYSLVAFGTFYLVYTAFKAAPRGDTLWSVGDGIWMLATLLMLLGSILLAGSFIGNPALPSPKAATDAAGPVRGVFNITRHPMMWGFALWAIVHILVAPYGAQITLCLGMAILALGGSLGQDAKKATLMGDSWRNWASRTAFVPFSGQIRGRTKWGAAWPGRTAVLGGVAIWLLASYLHPVLGGPIAGLWRWLG